MTRAVGWVAAAIPFAVLLVVVSRYGYNFPFQDQWVFAHDVTRLFGGTLTFHDLWTPHNEHRILFPRLVMLGLARLTAWNNKAEVWLNVALGVGVFMILLRLASKSAREADGAAPWWLLLVISCLAFSLNQAENWLWGWQITIFMNVLAVLTGVLSLQMNSFSWIRFGLAIAAGIIASYSFATGLLYWFAAIPSVLAMREVTARRRWLALGFWLAAAGLVIALFFNGYIEPEPSPVAFALRHPGAVIAYALAFIGAQCSYFLASGVSLQADVWGSTALGAAGLAGFVAVIVYLWKSRTAPAGTSAPYVSLALYALGAALLTALGRAKFGVAQATTSRYCTIANLFWFSLILLMWRVSTGPHIRRGLGRGGALLMILFLGAQQAGAGYCIRYFVGARHYLGMAMDAVRSDSDEPLFLNAVSPSSPGLVTRYRPILEARRLSVFGSPIRSRNALSKSFCANGASYARSRSFLIAGACYRTALKLDPGRIEALDGLMQIAFARKDWSGAQRDAQRELAAQPDNVRARCNLGVALAKQKKYGPAFAEFRRARETDPRNPLGYLSEAEVRAELLQLGSAAALYRAALRLDPQNVRAQMALSAVETRLASMSGR